MLVLHRKTGEHITVGDDIHVFILAVKGKRVKIGITAPPTVAIVRTELLTRSTPVSQEDSPRASDVAS